MIWKMNILNLDIESVYIDFKIALCLFVKLSFLQSSLSSLFFDAFVFKNLKDFCVIEHQRGVRLNAARLSAILNCLLRKIFPTLFNLTQCV